MNKNPTRNGILRMIARLPDSKRWGETVTHIEILYRYLQSKDLVEDFKKFESSEYRNIIWLSTLDYLDSSIDEFLKKEDFEI